MMSSGDRNKQRQRHFQHAVLRGQKDAREEFWLSLLLPSVGSGCGKHRAAPNHFVRTGPRAGPKFSASGPCVCVYVQYLFIPSAFPPSSPQRVSRSPLAFWHATCRGQMTMMMHIMRSSRSGKSTAEDEGETALAVRQFIPGS